MQENRDRCKCCEIGNPLTPETIVNRPGLSQIAYRVGTYASFQQAMIEAITKSSELRDWTARKRDDYGVALLEMWAYLADILTFYQERIANEAFLRTALQRDSIIRMATMLDYKLNPGAAAVTNLAFFLEEGSDVNVPISLKVQSVPGQNEKPQKFETVEEIMVHSEFNTLKPRLKFTRPQEICKGIRKIYLKGVDTHLKAGDTILFVGDDRERHLGSERWDFRILQTVTPYPEEDYTLVTWEEGLGHRKPSVEPADNPKVFAFRMRAALFGHNAPDWRTMSDDTKETFAGKNWRRKKQWPGFEVGKDNQIYLDDLYPKILEKSWIVLMKPNYVELYKATEVTVDSQTDFTLTAQTTRIKLDTGEHLSWFNRRDVVLFAQSEQLDLAEEPLTWFLHGNKIILDRRVEGLKKGQPVIINGKRIKFVKVFDTVEDLFQEASTCLRSVRLKSCDLLLQDIDSDVLPYVLIYDKNNRLHLIEKGGSIGFHPAQSDENILSLTAEGDEIVTEAAFIEGVYDKENTIIILQNPLKNIYDPKTMNIYANIVKATHGETISDEILGSGDATNEFQEFTLNKSPTTFVPQANAPRGIENTLKIRIEGVLWDEVGSLYGQSPKSQVYVSRISDDGKMSVRFGDGKTGARLPTGRNNVVAEYRKGLGSEGNVRANTLKTLLDRPVGLKSVTNPKPAEGGTDPESLLDARTNAPNTVRTFERAISLQDYEDIARGYTGIAKAKAAIILKDVKESIQLTIAGENGVKIETGSQTYNNFVGYLNLHRDINHQIDVVHHENIFLTLKVIIQVDPAYVEGDTLSAARTAVLNYFDFDNLQLGQGIHLSNIYGELQKVKGVKAVKIEYLDYVEKDTKVIDSSPPSLIAHIIIESNQIAALKNEDLIIESFQIATPKEDNMITSSYPTRRRE